MSKIYKLTKKEIGEAIVNYIAIFYEHSAFFPYEITDTDEKIELPDSITFHLDYVPKGTRGINHAL